MMRCARVLSFGAVTMNEFDRCLRDGRIVRVRPSASMVKKELGAATFDLETAEDSLARNNAKWASVQA